jgi:hypothetical protein
MKDVFGTTAEQAFHTSGGAKYPTSWSPDGEWIAFHTRGEDTQWDVAIAPTTGVVTPRPLLHSRFNEVQAQFSPDGRWVAYTSDESDQAEVYVQSIGDRPWRVQISVNGGDDPHWRGDGKELFYVSSDGYMTAVTLRQERQALGVDRPQRLFRIRSGAGRTPYLSSFDVAPRGDRFLIRVPKEDVRSLPLTVLVNRSIAPAR